MFTRRRPLISLALGLLALASAGSPARAQSNVFNPYGNSGYADYREFASPVYSNNPSLPGQARLQDEQIGGRPRANQYQAYTDSLGGSDSEFGSRGGRPVGGAGVPYYRAYRQLNQESNRVYRPNDNEASRKFDERLRSRDLQYARSLEAHAKAMEERDPVKRAKLLRQIEQDAARPTTATSPRTAPAARAAAPRAGQTPAAASAAAAATRAPARPRAAQPAATPTQPAAAPPTGPRTVAPAVPVTPAARPTEPSTIPASPPR